MFSQPRVIRTEEFSAPINQDLSTSCLDLDLTKAIANPLKSRVRRTPNQLMKNVANSNCRFNYTQSELSRAAFDMTRQGIDIDKLERQLESTTRKYDRKKEEQIRQDVEDCYFYIPNITLQSLEDFRNKLFEYSMMAELQESLSRPDLSRDLRRRVMARNIGVAPPSEEDATTRNFTSRLKVHIANRNETTQKRFSKIIGEYVSHNCTMGITQLARLFYNSTENNVIWAALIQHAEAIEGLAVHPTTDTTRKLINCSVRMLQEENADVLPRQQFAVETFVKNSLLADPEAKKCYIYVDPKTSRPVWAIVYCLLKAGRTSDILKMGDEIHRGTFFEDFQAYLSGGLRSKAIWRGENNQSDMFLDTLYSLFNRQPLIQPRVVKDSTDLLWFGLKIMDLQTDCNGQFSLHQMKKMMISRNNEEQNARSLLNLLYCTAYDDLLEEADKRISIDDSTHMLIVMERMGFIEGKLLNKTYEEYTGTLLAYAMDIINTGLENSLNYLLLCYHEDRPSQTRSALFNRLERLLLDRNLVEEFFGSFPYEQTKYMQQIKRIVPDCAADFTDLIKKVSEVYIKKQKYVYPALLFLNLLKDPARSLDCLLEMKLSMMLEDRVIDEAEKREGAALILKLMKSNKCKDQALLVNFVECFQSLVQAYTAKNVSDELTRNRFVPRSTSIDPDTQQLLIELNNRNSLILYFQFYEKMLMALDIDYILKADRYAYQRRLQAFEEHFRKLRQHSLISSNQSALKAMLTKVTNQLNLSVI